MRTSRAIDLSRYKRSYPRDGRTHVLYGFDQNGIVYKFAPPGSLMGQFRVAEITDIKGATGDSYWLKDRQGDWKWRSSTDRARVLVQYVDIDADTISEAADKDSDLLSGTEIMYAMLEYLSQWGGTSDLVYKDRAEAIRYLKIERF